MYLADTDMCLCIDNEGRIQPSGCLCSKQGCRCRSQRITALLDCAHVQGLKHQGFLLFSAFPKEMGRWRGGTHCAMVKMTMHVLLTDVPVWAQWSRFLTDIQLENMWWVWNLDQRRLSEDSRVWDVCTLLSFPVSHRGTLYLWLNLSFRYC